MGGIVSPLQVLLLLTIVFPGYLAKSNLYNRIELKTQKLTHTLMVTWSLTRELKPSSGKNISIFNKWCWHNWQLTYRRMWIDPFLSPCNKVKSKWIKKLHIKPETLKLIEEKVEKSLEDMHTGGKNPELNSNGLCCKIKNQQMGPHKIVKLL